MADRTPVDREPKGYLVLIFAILVHILDSFLRHPGRPITIAGWSVAIFGYVFVAWLASGIIKESRKELFFVTLISILALPLLGFVAKFTTATSIMFFMVNPIWVWYLIGKNKVRLFGLFFLLFWFGLMIFSFGEPIMDYANQYYDIPDVPMLSPGMVLRYFLHAVNQATVNMWQGLIGFRAQFWKTVEEEIAIAKGDYYTGTVDQAATKRLGVFLQNLRPAASRFFVNEPVTLFANLKAETLDKPITINIECKADNTPANAIIPTKTFRVETFEETDIDCVFDNLPEGYYTGKLSADFDFGTRAYHKAYFMDKERLRDYRRRQVDPLEGIPDKQPTTIYTSGPVAIGMGFGSQPIGIAQGEKGPTIGASVTNAWTGKIKEITKLIFYVPKGLKVTDINGIDVQAVDCSSLDTDEQAVCDPALVNVYQLPAADLAKLKNVSIYSFRAHTEIESTQDLLGESPLAINNFKVSANYKYLYETQTGFRVEQQP